MQGIVYFAYLILEFVISETPLDLKCGSTDLI